MHAPLRGRTIPPPAARAAAGRQQAAGSPADLRQSGPAGCVQVHKEEIRSRPGAPYLGLQADVAAGPQVLSIQGPREMRGRGQAGVGGYAGMEESMRWVRAIASGRTEGAEETRKDGPIDGLQGLQGARRPPGEIRAPGPRGARLTRVMTPGPSRPTLSFRTSPGRNGPRRSPRRPAPHPSQHTFRDIRAAGRSGGGSPLRYAISAGVIPSEDTCASLSLSLSDSLSL